MRNHCLLESNILPTVPSLLYFLLPLEVTPPIAWTRGCPWLNHSKCKVGGWLGNETRDRVLESSVLPQPSPGLPRSAIALLQMLNRTAHSASSEAQPARGGDSLFIRVSWWIKWKPHPKMNLFQQVEKAHICAIYGRGLLKLWRDSS